MDKTLLFNTNYEDLPSFLKSSIDSYALAASACSDECPCDGYDIDPCTSDGVCTNDTPSKVLFTAERYVENSSSTGYRLYDSLTPRYVTYNAAFYPNSNVPAAPNSNYVYDSCSPSSVLYPTSDFSVSYYYNRIKVTCTKYIYYDNTYVGSEQEGGLLAGGTYTPEAHLPSYDSTKYDFSYCNPSGSMTCPNTDFSVDYYFTRKKVTCQIIRYFDEVSEGSVYSTASLIPEQVYSLSAYMPSVSNDYEFSYAQVNGVGAHLISTFTAPNANFTLDYHFVSKSKVWIYANNNWNRATPWIYATKNGITSWYQAKPYIYSDGHWNPQ